MNFKQVCNLVNSIVLKCHFMDLIIILWLILGDDWRVYMNFLILLLQLYWKA